MDLEKNKKTIIELIIFTVVLIFALQNIGPIFNFILYCLHLFMPFILGAVIAFVLNVLLNLIEKKWLNKLFNNKNLTKYKRTISLIISLLLILLFLGLLLFLVVPELKNAVTIFAQNLPSYINNVNVYLNKWGVETDSINKITNIFNELKDNSLLYIRDNKDFLLSSSLSIATSLISTITNLCLGFIFAIYILAQKERLNNQANKIMKAYFKEKQINKMNQIFTLANKVCSNFISGQCLEAVIIGFLCFIGMLILQLPYATTISVLIGFTALIPVFGAFIGTTIGAFLIFMINPIEAIVFVIFILLLQQVEGNFIYPRVVGKSVGLPGIWVMVAVTVGASVAGIIGMLISVPLCSIVYSIFATNVNLRLQKQKHSLRKNK